MTDITAPSNAIVVDDTPANQTFLVRLLTQAGYNVQGASCGQDALDTIYKIDSQIKLAVVDMELPDMSGLQLTMRLRERFPEALIIVATMHDQISWIRSAFDAGANIYLIKPHGFMELFSRLSTSSTEKLCKEGYLVVDQYGPRPFQVTVKS